MMFRFRLYVYRMFSLLFPGLTCVVVFSYPVQRMRLTCFIHELAKTKILGFLCLTVCDHRVSLSLEREIMGVLLVKLGGKDELM